MATTLGEPAAARTLRSRARLPLSPLLRQPRLLLPVLHNHCCRRRCRCRCRCCSCWRRRQRRLTSPTPPPPAHPPASARPSLSAAEDMPGSVDARLSPQLAQAAEFLPEELATVDGALRLRVAFCVCVCVCAALPRLCVRLRGLQQPPGVQDARALGAPPDLPFNQPVNQPTTQSSAQYRGWARSTSITRSYNHSTTNRSLQRPGSTRGWAWPARSCWRRA